MFFYNKRKKYILLSSVFSLILTLNTGIAFAKEPPKIKKTISNFSKTPNIPKLNKQEIKLTSKEDINAVFEIGVKLYEEQKYDESIEVFKKIVVKFPGYGDAQYYIGLCNFSAGNYYIAIAYFLEANRIFDGSKMDAMFGAGLSYLSSGYTEEAKTAFKKVIKNSKDKDLIEDTKNWMDSIDEQILQKEKVKLLTEDLDFREGIEYLDTQNYDKAEKAFLKTVQNKPSSALPMYYLGNALYLREKYQEAVQTFEKVILIDPNSKIAKDSNLYIRVIEEIEASSQYGKPLYLQLSTGLNYDSNLSYADTSDIIISDMGGNTSISAGYNINPNLKTEYDYYGNVFSGINDKLPNLISHSYDFNLQRHSINIKSNYAFAPNLLGEGDVSGNWYVLGGNSFLLNGRLSPKGYFYLTPNFITVIQYILDINNYSVFKTRNSIDQTLDLSQYFYFMNNNLWLRTAYVFKKVNANDQTLTQSGLLEDGNKYDLFYNLTNSMFSNDFLLSLGFNSLPFNSKLKLEGKLSFNNYDNEDVYRLTSPVTNLSTGTTENKSIKTIRKKRTDFLYGLGFNLSVPVYTNLSANLYYNYLNNTSNIKIDDYAGRSYLKHIAGFNLNYDF